MSINSCCLKVSLHDGEATGRTEKLDDLESYTVADNSGSAEKVLIFISDVFGIPLINNKLLCDAYANAGYLVLFPDLFNGNAISYPIPEGFDFPGWAQQNDPVKAAARLESYISYVKATYKPKYVVAAGYCYGAKVLAELIVKEDTLLDAGALFHPSFFEQTLIAKLGAKPLFIAAAETDPAFTPDLRHFTEDALKEKKALYFITLASGVEHGFSVKGDISKPVVKFAKEKAFKDSIDFLEFVHSQA